MTALKMEGRALIPANSIAITNGECRLDDPSALYSGLFAGTIRPTMNKLTM